MFSNQITDSAIDRFYGEYESPALRQTRNALTCWNCEEVILPEDEFTRLPDYDEDAPGAPICKECAGKRELLESVFNALTTSQKLEILGMEMRVYNG